MDHWKNVEKLIWRWRPTLAYVLLMILFSSTKVTPLIPEFDMS